MCLIIHGVTALLLSYLIQLEINSIIKAIKEGSVMVAPPGWWGNQTDERKEAVVIGCDTRLQTWALFPVVIQILA